MTLQVCELFVSIQGEGSAQGRPCTFIRLAGCPLRCRWCDTVYARDGGEPATITELVAEATRRAVPLVEITGGEPLAQAETPALASALLDAGFEVLVETSGAFDIGALPDKVVRVVDLKPPGSGEDERIRWANLDLLRPDDDVKLVLADRADYRWAADVIERHDLARRCTVWLGAVHPRLDPAELAAWIVEDRLPVRLQIQLHKVLWPAAERGR